MGRPIIKAYKKCELRDELGKYTIYLIVTLCSSKKLFFLEQESKNVTTNPLKKGGLFQFFIWPKLLEMRKIYLNEVLALS